MSRRETLAAEVEQLERDYDRPLAKSAAHIGSGEDGFTDAETQQARIDRDCIGSSSTNTAQR